MSSAVSARVDVGTILERFANAGLRNVAITLAVGPVVDQSFENVGAMLDFFCGYDWDRWSE